jgi:hypothetical protein
LRERVKPDGGVIPPHLDEYASRSSGDDSGYSGCPVSRSGAIALELLPYISLVAIDLDSHEEK